MLVCLRNLYILLSDAFSQKYISLPPRTSVSRLSKRHAHKKFLNARFQNSDFVFEQLKPGIIFARHAAKKVTKPRKSRRTKIYISVRTTCEKIKSSCDFTDSGA